MQCGTTSNAPVEPANPVDVLGAAAATTVDVPGAAAATRVFARQVGIHPETFRRGWVKVGKIDITSRGTAR